MKTETITKYLILTETEQQILQFESLIYLFCPLYLKKILDTR